MPEAKIFSNNKCFVTWELKANESGDAFNLGKWKALSVTVEGDFAGASVKINGNNNPDSQSAFILNDPNGNPLAFMSGRIEAILEDCVKIMPIVSGGTERTNLTVTLLVTPWK